MSSEKTITDQILKLSLVDFNHLSHAAPVPNRPPQCSLNQPSKPSSSSCWNARVSGCPARSGRPPQRPSPGSIERQNGSPKVHPFVLEREQQVLQRVCPGGHGGRDEKRTALLGDSCHRPHLCGSLDLEGTGLEDFRQELVSDRLCCQVLAPVATENYTNARNFRFFLWNALPTVMRSTRT